MNVCGLRLGLCPKVGFGDKVGDALNDASISHLKGDITRGELEKSVDTFVSKTKEAGQMPPENRVIVTDAAYDLREKAKKSYIGGESTEIVKAYEKMAGKLEDLKSTYSATKNPEIVE